MNDFLTPAMLRDYALAVAVTVMVTNFILAWQPARRYAKLIAWAVALVIVLAAQGLPGSFPAGVVSAVNAVMVAMTALGSNTLVSDALAARQPQARGLYAAAAPRFWRKW